MTIDFSRKVVRHYESLNIKRHTSPLDELAWGIVHVALPEFGVEAINSLIQFDAYGCGYFVCMNIWRLVDSRATSMMSASSDLARHFQIFLFVLSGERAW